jgi:cytidylate kinase
LLDQIADRFHECRRMLELVDETQSSWVYDVLGNWMDCQIVPHAKYFRHLCRVILEAAHCEHAVFVGRGAQFLLPRQHLLAVRLVASPKYRVRQFMAETGMNEIDARRTIMETDAGRREFVEQFLHRDVADPHFYDLVVNVERSGREAAIDEILTALEPHTLHAAVPTGAAL